MTRITLRVSRFSFFDIITFVGFASSIIWLTMMKMPTMMLQGPCTRTLFQHERLLPKTLYRSFFASAPKREDASSKEEEEDRRVTVEIDKQGIARVTLNRPSKMNALDMHMFEAIAETAASLKNNKAIRAVILSGSGRAFCTGLDVTSIVTNKPVASVARLLERKENNKLSNLAQDVGYLWRDLPVPVIACLHGMCFGGGMQVALGADFRLATPDCKLSVMEAKWGLIPDMSASVTLRELVRIDVAKELTMTGRVILGTVRC